MPSPAPEHFLARVAGRHSGVLVKRWLKILLRVFVLPLDGIAAVWLFLSALWWRFGRWSTPRVVWGPTPLKPISYNSQALRRVGVESWTSVDNVYQINRAEDFDEYLESFSIPVPYVGSVVGRYVRFHSLLQRSQVFITCFDGGFLRGTNLRFLEHIFLRLGKKKLIVWPYGSDTYVPSRMQDTLFRDGLLADYPMLAQTEKHTRRQIRYFCKHADFVVGNVPHAEALPRQDVLTIACYGVDTAEWRPASGFRHVGDGTAVKPPVKIFHCPNHRHVKGTAYLVAAYEALRRAGLHVELEIAEKVTNDAIRVRMATADIVAAQCLYGYASTELEGMSLGKPVLANLDNPYYYEALRQQSFLRFCPIVSVTPATLYTALRQLVCDPVRRAALGVQGRTYVERFHSLPAQAKFWQEVITGVCGKTSGREVQHWWESS